MEKWIEIMLNNSILMSVVILLLLLLSKLFFKKNSAKWRYYTWLVVIIGLLIPFRPTFDIIPVQIAPPVQFAAQNIIPVISEQPGLDGLQTNKIENPSEISPTPVSSENNSVTIYWPMVIVVVWAAGFLMSIMYYFLKHRRFLKAVKRWSRDFDKEKIFALLDKANAELSITKCLEVKTCKIVSTPMLIGLIKPVILLPPNDFEYDELELIIRHELTHYKRKDLWYKALVLFTNAVHWFNPFVYIMARAVTTDCEMSCDEAVLKDKDIQQRMLYGETIISIIKNQSSVSTVFSTGFKGGKKTMEKRMFSIMDTAKKRAGVVISCTILVCTLLTGMVAYASENKELGANTSDISVTIKTAKIGSEVYYLIENGEQLRLIGSGTYPLSGNYMLNADITLSKEIEWVPIGTIDQPFTGSFTGNGFEIIDLTITDPAVKYIGMFGYAENAKIYNVTLRNVDIMRAFQKGDTIAPILAWGKNCESYDNQIIDPVE